MRGVCCRVAINITVWTILHLKTFLWSCLPLEECAQESLLVEYLACDQITPVCYGRLGDDTIVSCEDKIQVCFSILLSAGKAREMGTKGVPAEIQKPEAVTPKRADSTTLDLFISLYCHWKLSQSSSSLLWLPSLSTEQPPMTHRY